MFASPHTARLGSSSRSLAQRAQIIGQRPFAAHQTQIEQVVAVKHLLRPPRVAHHPVPRSVLAAMRGFRLSGSARSISSRTPVLSDSRTTDWIAGQLRP